MANYIDPVCKMTVTDDRETEKHEYKGKLYYFCSTACKRMFEKDLEKYLKTEKQIKGGSI
ncbi:MAG: YHS domain-containing protein [Deltaproteobacteria bacterium]|nr:YHS domain-containing protein [Deltaproteobacteria bacterium]